MSQENVFHVFGHCRVHFMADHGETRMLVSGRGFMNAERLLLWGIFYCCADRSWSLSLDTSITGIDAWVEESACSVDSVGSTSFLDDSASENSSTVGEDGSSGSLGGGGVADLWVFSLTTLSSELAGLPPNGLFITTASSEYGALGGESDSSWLVLLRSDREVREFPCEYDAGRPSASATAASSSGSLAAVLSALELA